MHHDADLIEEKRREMGTVTALMADFTSRDAEREEKDVHSEDNMPEHASEFGGVSEHETTLIPEPVIRQSSQDSTAVVTKLFDRYGVDDLQTARLTDHVALHFRFGLVWAH